MNKYYTFLIVITFSSSLISQDTIGIPSENVEVIKRFEAAVQQATSKKMNIQVEDATSSELRYSYDVWTTKLIDFDRPEPMIQALGYKHETDKAVDIKDGYIYGGYGNHKTVTAGAAYHYYIEDWLEAGLSGDHFSVHDPIDSEASEYSHSELGVYLGYFLRPGTKVRLTGQGNRMKHDLPNLISLDTSFVPESLPINYFGGALDLSHTSFENKKFVSRLGARYGKIDHEFDDYNENILSAHINLFKQFGEGIVLDIPVSLAYLTDGRDSVGNVSYTDIIFNPNIRAAKSNYTLKLGIEYISGTDLSYFSPTFDFKISKVIEAINLRFFSDNEFFRHSLNELSKINPFYHSASSTYRGYYKRSYNLNLERELLSGLFADVTLAYNNYKNDYNFRDDNLTQRYDAEVVNRDELALTPHLEYAVSEMVSFETGLTYRFFLTDSLDLYYKPTYDLFVSGSQKILDEKLSLKQTLYYVGDRKFVNNKMDNPRHQAFVDLSLEAAYQINPSFSIFAKGTNLLGREYVIWNNQPVLRTQVWGGLKVLF